ncbi:MAG: ABC transporter ATP-binding protein [Thermodesulfobacteriota bacterium]|jgi:ABC-type Fe3+/spermidine/putrescine transport system ATPase subunit
MIEIRGLKITAGNFRIEHLDLVLPEGSYHVLLGPTGSGKTLILESIIGLRNLQGGKIIGGGKEIQDLPPEQRGMSYVPQDLALFPHLTVRDNLLYGLQAKKKSAGKNEDHLDRLIDALRIGHLLNRYPLGLSGGEKQRVALGRALAPSPQLLLLDEPLAALDPGLRNEIQQLLISLHRSLKFTALHVTHDLEEAYLLGDAITVLIDGKVEQRGKREEVFLRPNTVKVADFLGLRNLFSERVLKISGDGKFLTVSFWGRESVLPSDHAPRYLSAGEPVVLYLRPEEVMILREEKPIKESLRRHILAGKVVRILDRGTHRWVLFQPAGMDIHLEVHLPNYVFRHLSIREDQEIRVAMRWEAFWVIPEYGNTK